MNHLSTMAQTFILLSTGEFNMVRLSDRHCSGSSIMPQKRNPCSLEVIKAKTSFAHGIVMSLLSTGKALFMGYNRDTQWTKYWIMDLAEEAQPSLFVMADVIRFLQVNKATMVAQARKEFIGATSLMEWMVRSHGVPLRKAKMAMEKAVKYSEEEEAGEVSYKSLKRALNEMRIAIPITKQEAEKVQRPEGILAQTLSIGMPSEKRVRGEILSLRERVRHDKNWFLRKRREIEKARDLIVKMENELVGES